MSKLVPGVKTLEIINYGPCVIELWQIWSLGEKFGEITSLVPEVSSLAEMVPGISNLGKYQNSSSTIEAWQKLVLMMSLGKLHLWSLSFSSWKNWSLLLFVTSQTDPKVIQAPNPTQHPLIKPIHQIPHPFSRIQAQTLNKAHPFPGLILPPRSNQR